MGRKQNKNRQESDAPPSDVPQPAGEADAQAANQTGDEAAGAAPGQLDDVPPTTEATPAKRSTPEEKAQHRTPAPRQANYGATADATPTPARDPGASTAPPPTPATAYKERPKDATTTMRHATGVIVERAGAAAPSGEGSPLVTDRSGCDVPEAASGGDVDYSARAMWRKVFTDKWQIKALLVAVPVALMGAGHVTSDILFFAAFFGLIPLAALLGDFTEDLALRSNDVVGALLNVTFGNATELIISIMALRAGMMDVIKLSLIGSVLGNMLLVLGTAFIVGGMKNSVMSFNCDAVNTFSPLLMLSILSFVIPSAYWSMTASEHNRHDAEVILSISRQLALAMVVAYGAYLYFQLVTHKHLFDSEAAGSADFLADADEEEEEEEEVPQFTGTFALIGLAVASVLISMLSDTLVDTLTDAAKAWHLPKQFIGIILVPIVGNAAEHASAIFMAARNKLDISVGVALGSSIQIAMFVMPVLVLCGWAIGAPLNMDFHPFLTVTTAVSVLVVQNVTNDGKTNWLEGLLLVLAYFMIACMFWNGEIQM